MTDVYAANPRHKQPWQVGARGTLCPPDVDGPALFESATTDPRSPGKRYNTDGERAYCAHPDIKNSPDTTQVVTWHGFPVSWRDVPTTVQRQWITEGRIARLRLRG